MKSKLSLLLVAAGIFTMPIAQACTLNINYANQNVAQVLNSNGGWNFSRYNEICEKLQKNSAALTIIADNGVLQNKSFAAVTIGLKDLDTFSTTTAWGASHFRLSDIANGAEAQKMLYLALNNAIENWQTVDEALQQLEISRRFDRGYYTSMGSTEVAPLKKPKSK